MILDFSDKEFLVSQIRLGIIYHNYYVIKPFKLIDIIQSKSVYQRFYDNYLSDNVMTEDEMTIWLYSNKLWSNILDDQIKETEERIKDIKLEMYKNSHLKHKVESLRKNVRSLESLLVSSLSKKDSFFSNTCERQAEYNQKVWLLSKSIEITNLEFNIEDNLNSILYHYKTNLLDEKTVRQIARTEPWLSTWSVQSKSGTSLFKKYEDSDLTINQKNLLLWSQTYENIQESVDCPNPQIINDDDLLDGWFIDQSKKRESEYAKKEIDRRISPKVKDSQEVFIISNDKEDAKSIQAINDDRAKNILRSRYEQLDQNKSVDFYDFKDKKMEVIAELNNAKNKKRGL